LKGGNIAKELNIPPSLPVQTVPQHSVIVDEGEVPLIEEFQLTFPNDGNPMSSLLLQETV